MTCDSGQPASAAPVGEQAEKTGDGARCAFVPAFHGGEANQHLRAEDKKPTVKKQPASSA